MSVLAAAAEGTGRRLACLYRAGLVVTSVDLESGYIQVVTVGSTGFVHVHLDAGSFSIVARVRSVETIIAPFLASSSTLPILVGDFNCVTDPVDTGANYWHKMCPPLAAMVAAFGYVDAYPLLHQLPAFTFRRRGMAGSRLDRAYLPGPLAAHLEAAWRRRTVTASGVTASGLANRPWWRRRILFSMWPLRGWRRRAASAGPHGAGRPAGDSG